MRARVPDYHPTSPFQTVSNKRFPETGLPAYHTLGNSTAKERLETPGLHVASMSVLSYKPAGQRRGRELRKERGGNAPLPVGSDLCLRLYANVHCAFVNVKSSRLLPVLLQVTMTSPPCETWNVTPVTTRLWNSAVQFGFGQPACSADTD